jgi:hypothetical protein
MMLNMHPTNQQNHPRRHMHVLMIMSHTITSCGSNQPHAACMRSPASTSSLAFGGTVSACSPAGVLYFIYIVIRGSYRYGEFTYGRVFCRTS